MDDTTRALHDRAELEEVMNRYAASIDLRDWARLGTVFADGEIAVDFTSMGVKQVFRGPTERWVDAVRQTITSFDATSISSPTIRPRSTATARWTPATCRRAISSAP